MKQWQKLRRTARRMLVGTRSQQHRCLTRFFSLCCLMFCDARRPTCAFAGEWVIATCAAWPRERLALETFEQDPRKLAVCVQEGTASSATCMELTPSHDRNTGSGSGLAIWRLSAGYSISPTCTLLWQHHCTTLRMRRRTRRCSSPARSRRSWSPPFFSLVNGSVRHFRKLRGGSDLTPDLLVDTDWPNVSEPITVLWRRCKTDTFNVDRSLCAWCVSRRHHRGNGCCP